MAASIATALAGPFEIISKVEPSAGSWAGGSGDSEIPIVSPDGRYVLFTSTANNLLGTASNTPLPSAFPPKLNVFLRDRINNTTTLVSVNLWGTDGGNDDSVPVMFSTNAQYVLFESAASDLVAGDTNAASDIFIRDLVHGTTTLVSANTNGNAGQSASQNATMTPDGRYVAFVSAAADFVPNDTNGIPDVFVRDCTTGTTTLASVGARSSNIRVPFFWNSSESPLITPDGRYVAFLSAATNFVPGVRTASDIYLRDLVMGTTTQASSQGRNALKSVFGTADGFCYNHSLSDDGQFIAYEVCRASGTDLIEPAIVVRCNTLTGQTDVVSTNACTAWSHLEELHTLEMTPDGRFIAFTGNTNGTDGSTTCIYVWDGQSGTSALASTNLLGEVPDHTTCAWITLDSQARWVAFLSTSTNMVTNAVTGDLHLYLHDLLAGTTTLVDVNTNGVELPITREVSPSFSADGRFVAFEGLGSPFVPGPRNQTSDIFLRDLATGNGEIISAHAPGLALTTASGSSMIASSSASADGRYIAFVSDGKNLSANDTNLVGDIYVRDRATGSNVLVSVCTNGLAGSWRSVEPAISGNGRYVVFSSTADDLVAGDTNNRSDIFLRDLESGSTFLVSMNASGTGSGNDASYAHKASSDGRYVLFLSAATNLTTDSLSGYEHLFLRDVQAGTNYALTTNYYKVTASALTPNGRFAAFVVPSQNMYCVWDSQLLRRISTTSATGLRSQIAISPDGSRVVVATTDGIAAAIIADNSTVVIADGTPPATSSLAGWRFSSDGRWFVYTCLINGTNQVYLYDFQERTNFLVSAGFLSTAPAFGRSDSPDISPDARFVAFRSAASDLVPGDTNSLPDIFVFDRQNSTMTLLSSSRFGSSAGNSRSSAPFFTADGNTLLFQSWASDLVPSDFNQNVDVFAYSLYYSGAIPLFHAQVLPGAGTGQSPTVSWPTLPGKTYHVQFKNDLNDTAWQDLPGGIVILGNQGYFTETSSPKARRFYRVVASDETALNSSGKPPSMQDRL